MGDFWLFGLGWFCCGFWDGAGFAGGWLWFAVGWVFAGCCSVVLVCGFVLTFVGYLCFAFGGGFDLVLDDFVLRFPGDWLSVVV